MDEAFEGPDPPPEELRNWFLASASALRPTLHRFCSLMSGSALDGEDLVQETLAAARHNLGSLRSPADVEDWLVRMSLQRCFDFAQRDLGFRENHLTYGAPMGPQTYPGLPLENDLVSCVDALHPRERAPAILKDVLGYDWLQVATIDVSTVGHAKMAVYWGRSKLRALSPPRHSEPRVMPDIALLRAYSDASNRRDLGALTALVPADARIEIVGAAGKRPDDVRARYLADQTELGVKWTLTIARVDGEIVLVRQRPTAAEISPHSAIRLFANRGRLYRIRDYAQIDDILGNARVESFLQAS